MLSNATLDAFVQQNTATVADALVKGQLLGTEVGDRVFAAIVNYPERHAALIERLAR